MNPRVVAVQPYADYTLVLTFAKGEIKIFDVKPYLNIGIFQELQDQRYFNSVRPVLGSLQWQNGQDFCPDTLYLDSVPHCAPGGWECGTARAHWGAKCNPVSQPVGCPMTRGRNSR